MSAMYQHSRKFAFSAAMAAMVLCLAGCPDDDVDTGSGGGGARGSGSAGNGETFASAPARVTPEQTAATLQGEDTWHNSEGCPPDWPVPLYYPKNDNLYEGLSICYSGTGEYIHNSVLSNHGDKVWAFSPGSLRDFDSRTEESGYFRAAFLPDTTQRWYLVPGEVAPPTIWDYQWSPDFKQTAAWTGYKLAADRYKEMDQTIYLQLLKRRDPNAAALASCAKSAGESFTSVQELGDAPSALRKLSASLKATTTGYSCAKAIKDLDAAHPEAAKKVPTWTTYAEKAADASPTATKWAAVLDEVFKFCSHVNLPKIGC